MVFIFSPFAGADPGFFLGGGALVFYSTSTPISHIVFFAEYQLYKKTAGGRRGRGGGADPLHPPPRSAPDLFFKLSSENNLWSP